MAPVEIDDATGVLSFGFDITYDTALLDLSDTDVKSGSLTSSGWFFVTNIIGGGLAKVGGYSTIPLTGGSGSLLEIDFHVIGSSGTSVLDITGTLNGGNISASPGSINVVSEPPIPGDANLDDQVDDADAYILATNWLVGSSATWGMGNFNGDGYVNDVDATIMAANWQVGVPAKGAIPEPGMIILLAGALLSLLMWRAAGKRDVYW